MLQKDMKLVKPVTFTVNCQLEKLPVPRLFNFSLANFKTNMVLSQG
jgi:hypothetical protein